MTAHVMTCIHAQQHPNADALRCYNFKLGEKTYQIIANFENIYEVGDKAIIVLAPSMLKDNTNIRKSYLRNELSEGMALGKSDLPDGTDLTDEYCIALDDPNKPQMIPWPSIESLYNVKKNLFKYNESKRIIKYRAKIKVHGTNASIIIRPDGSFYCQSRNEIITTQCDNAGFANWVDSNKDYFSVLKQDVTIIVYGEFAGKGIMKGCAIHQIDRKIFCPFAIQYQTNDPVLEINPVEISRLLPSHKDIFVLPWHNEELILDFTDREQLLKQSEIINNIVLEVEKEDPFVKKEFNVSGLGEGIVCYPLPEQYDINSSIKISVDDFNNLGFKAKGKEHRVVSNKAAAPIDPIIAQSISEFAVLFCTEARLNQFVERVNGFDLKTTGLFLKEFNQDVQKESIAELEASNLTWDQVSKEVNNSARKWYIQKCNQL